MSVSILLPHSVPQCVQSRHKKMEGNLSHESHPDLRCRAIRVLTDKVEFLAPVAAKQLQLRYGSLVQLGR